MLIRLFVNVIGEKIFLFICVETLKAQIIIAFCLLSSKQHFGDHISVTDETKSFLREVKFC